MIAKMVYAIRNGDGYWYRETPAGSVMFITEQAAAQHYDSAATALLQRELLANLLHDESLSVCKIAVKLA